LIPVADGIDKSHLSSAHLEAGATITVHSTIEQEGSSNLDFQPKGLVFTLTFAAPRSSRGG
jgi:hypothetical protein